MADGSPNLPRDTLATAQGQRKMAGPEGGDCLSHHQLVGAGRLAGSFAEVQPRALGDRDHASRQGRDARRRRLHQPQRQRAAQRLHDPMLRAQNPEVRLALAHASDLKISRRQKSRHPTVRRISLNRPVRRSASVALVASLCLGGCASGGAPTYSIVGAFFPGWMICAVLGIVGAIGARGLFVATGLNRALPFQLFVCSSLGVIIAVLAWIYWFGQ